MIQSVTIQGYRALADFSMSGLGQINLLVGKNNTGKTSVLESLYLLATAGDPSALWRVMSRRGEHLAPDAAGGRNPQQELDICRLFYGHDLRLGVTAKITTRNQTPPRFIIYEITQAEREKNPALFAQLPMDYDGVPGASGLAMSVKGSPAPLAPLVPLTSKGGLRPETFQLLNNMAAASSRNDLKTPQYISTDSIFGPELAAAFSAISLTPHEDRVVRALRFVEPTLERIALAPQAGPVFLGGFPTRNGFKAKLHGIDQPVPIGSMGDGTWRMLALAITLSRSKDSLLLIDEIDTGLHYTVMKDMWRLVAEAARELNVQVFATTHSDDCVRSLASICRADVRVDSQVTIQRIKAGKKEAVPYTEAEITVIAEDRIEVR